jgi:hypothetical protein
VKSIGFIAGRRGGRIAAAVAFGLVLSGPVFAAMVPSLSLKVLDETATPGGLVQMKVSVTEPEPIVIGMARITYASALGTVQGLLLPEAPDSAGVGVIGDHSLVVRTVSPNGSLGTAPDGPAVVVTIAVPRTAAAGASGPLNLDPAASSFTDPSGNLYPLQVNEGTVRVGGTLSITDVLPGGGFLPAGSTISVIGIGFQPGATAEIDGIPVASSTRIDSTRIEAVTGAAAQLDGRMVSVRNPDHARSRYFSYLRATSLGESARPLLAAAEPIYPVQPISTGFFSTPTPAPGVFLGLALQNPGNATAAVSIELWSSGSVVASTSLSLPARTEIEREASELFSGVVPPRGSFLRVTASSPVQMLGLAGNDTTGSVAPLLPGMTFP